MGPGSSDPCVAVVGGGVAGAATCLALAREGLPVHWIAPELASEARAGDTLPANARSWLTDWQCDDLLSSRAHRPAPNSFSAWGSGALLERRHDATPQGAGWLIDRAVFDRELAARAAARPQVCRYEQRVSQVTAGSMSWRLTLTNGQSLRPAMIIDATGRNCRLARQWQNLHREDRLVATRWLLRSTDANFTPTATQLVEAEPNGWWFAALMADATLSLAWYADRLPGDVVTADANRLLTRARSTQWVQRWLREGAFAPVAAGRRCSAVTQWLETPAGWHADRPPWAAVGDAAFACDPLAAHGLTHAFWCAGQVAQSAANTLKGDRRALQAYASRAQQGRHRHLEQKAATYLAEARFAQQAFWQARRRAGSGLPRSI